MAKIVVIGSFNMDLITYVERIPAIGETVTDGELITMAGGKGSNQATGAARLGANVTMIACVGDDQFAQSAFDLWQSDNINTNYVKKAKNTSTGTASILVDAHGENMIAVAPGANRLLTIADIDAAENVIAEADVIMAQLEIPLDVVEYAFTIARKHDTRTLLNPAPVRDGLEKIIELADIITPNEGEAQMIGTLPAGKIVVTTLGSDGASWSHGQDSGRTPAFDVEAIDTVGGGDAFNAGLAVAIAEGKPLQQAVRFANAVAAIAVTRKGAAASMPTREEVIQLLDSDQ